MTDTDRTANGQFTRGNKAAAIAKAKTAPGHNGVMSYYGIVDSGERSPELVGAQKWVTYANSFSFPPVAIAALLRYALSSGAKWSLVENPSGSKEAIRGAEIVEQGLLNARLASDDTWAEVAAKANMSYFNGSSIHAAALARRKDGMVVFSDIAHRPMHTIQRWLSPNGTAPYTDVEQQIPDGSTRKLPLTECLYVVEKMLSDDPFGVGVLRLVAQRIKRAGDYEAIEGSELFSSLGGLPIVRVPLEEMMEELKDLPEAERNAEIVKRCLAIETAAKNRIKTPEKQMYVKLDSKTYEGVDSNKITTVPKWAIEIVKGQLQGLTESRKIITDLHMDVARILHVAFVYIGGGDTKGTFGAHDSMFDAFLRQLDTNNNRTAIRATNQLVRRQIAANGLDPDAAAPMLRVEKLTRESMTETLEALGLLNAAAPHPKDPLRNIVREHYQLPPEPEEVLDDMRAPRTKVDPNGNAAGEDDEDDLEDLEDETDDKESIK